MIPDTLRESREYFALAETEFSGDWYAKTYADDLARNLKPGETPLEYYFREGAHLGHDPHPYFSEIYFRLNNGLSSAKMAENPDLFGFVIFVARRENNKFSETCNYTTGVQLRRLRNGLDLDFIVAENSELAGNRLAAADFYFKRSLAKISIDPNPEFSELYYLDRYPDVRQVRDSGGLLSGYQHYINSGRREGRKARSVNSHKDNINTLLSNSNEHLEKNVPGISVPTEIGLADALSSLTRKLDVTVDPAAPRRIHVFLMHYFPEIFFGGFAAFFDFVNKIKNSQDIEIKLYVSSGTPPEVHEENVRRVAKYAPKVAAAFDEIELLPPSATKVTVSPDCDVLSYSMETHFLASQVGIAIGKTPYFFIQDDEAMFHPNDSIASTIYSAFSLDHFGVINSQSLLEYFQSAENYPSMHADTGYECVSFENKILSLKLDRPAFEALQTGKTRRKLVFYGRPERHAARNQYAFVITALRQAVAAGIFGDDWEFWSLGSLDHTGDISLGDGHVIKQITRVSKKDYESFIAGSDIGISMISTPHPGIIHFQMAAFGIVTLTNTGFMRTDENLTEISGNIIPVRLTFSSMLEGLRQAVERAGDYKTRYDRAIGSRITNTDVTLNAAVEIVSDRMTSTRRA